MDEKKILIDVYGADHLALEHGDRYKGWYLSKTELHRDWYPLGYDNKVYHLAISDYNYRFVMPMKIEFAGGLISYSDGDRELGVFRFPRDVNGNYVAPISLKPRNIETPLEFSTEEIKEIFSRKMPLVFDAYKIPQYGFQFFDINAVDLQGIETITNAEFTIKFKEEYETRLKACEDEALAKIASSPNFLLILQNILDKKTEDLTEASLMADNIIHI